MDIVREAHGSIPQYTSALSSHTDIEMIRNRPGICSMESQAGLGGRELYSKEQWEAQKDVIRQLYNHEKKPFKRVIDILRTEHNFFPTRRQFYRKISEWGFEKNIKDKEMRALVQDLSQRQKDGEDLTIELKGRQVDPVRIQRWQRRHGKANDVAHSFSSNLSISASSRSSLDNIKEHKPSANTTDCNAPDSLTDIDEPSQVLEDGRNGRFDQWGLVNVPGSPLLTRLFEALQIECDSLIPPVDLNSSNSVAVLLSNPETESDSEENKYINHEEWVDFTAGTSSKDLIRYSREVFQLSEMSSTSTHSGITELSFSEWSFREWDFSRGQPLKMNINHIIGLSPFPTSSQARQNGASKYTHVPAHARLKAIQDKEIEYKCMLRRFKRIWGPENPRTLVVMNNLAYICFELDKYKQAERLYRQLVISNQKLFGLNHVRTLTAYLGVVAMLRYRGEALQALKIHQRIHDNIIKLGDREIALILHSSSIKASMLYLFGQLEEADKLMRQTFQASLYNFGPRDEDTLHYMQVLAKILNYCGRHAESEQLRRINSQLYCETKGSSSEEFLDSIQRLIALWVFQGRFDECKNLAMSTAELMEASIGQEHNTTLYNLYIVAFCTRMQGDLEESERQMRIVLEKQMRYCSEHQKNVYMCMQELASILTEMGRYPEATTLLEKCHKVWSEFYGTSHPESLFCCQELGYNYRKLGRYEDAVTFLERNISDARNPERKATKELLLTISELARTLLEQDRYREAANYYEECVRGFTEMYGWSHRHSLDNIHGLGICYTNLECSGEVFALYKEAVDQISGLDGDEHPALMEILEWVTMLSECSDENENQIDEEASGRHRESFEDAELCSGSDDPKFLSKAADDNLAETEENWMGELFDFALLENHASNTIDSDVDVHVEET